MTNAANPDCRKTRKPEAYDHTSNVLRGICSTVIAPNSAFVDGNVAQAPPCRPSPIVIQYSESRNLLNDFRNRDSRLRRILLKAFGCQGRLLPSLLHPHWFCDRAIYYTIASVSCVPHWKTPCLIEPSLSAVMFRQRPVIHGLRLRRRKSDAVVSPLGLRIPCNR